MNARMICIFQQNRNTMNARMNRIIQSTVLQWRSQGGQGDNRPLTENLPPSCPPNKITLCTEVYGELPFWVPVSPPPRSLVSPPCRPLILKSLATPLLCWASIKQNEIARLSFHARMIKHSPTAHLNMLRWVIYSPPVFFKRQGLALKCILRWEQDRFCNEQCCLKRQCFVRPVCHTNIMCLCKAVECP